MNARLRVSEVLSTIRKNFRPGESFNNESLRKIFSNDAPTISYFMKCLTNKGELVQIKRNLWSLPGEDLTSSNQLCISRTERGILDSIFKMERKSEKGFSRFGLTMLKNSLCEKERLLLIDLIPKLKKVGIIDCVGNNGAQEKVLELNETLFLKYTTEPNLIKEISLTDLEIDQSIKSFIFKRDCKRKRFEEIMEKLSAEKDELSKCIEEIEALSKKRLSLEKEIGALNDEVKLMGTENEGETKFFDLIANMSPEQRLHVFKDILL